jgi:hypothetical protein
MDRHLRHQVQRRWSHSKAYVAPTRRRWRQVMTAAQPRPVLWIVVLGYHCRPVHADVVEQQ